MLAKIKKAGDMIQGTRYKANPTTAQRVVLSQWMGCARTIWNAKCEENRYMTAFAKRYCPIGTYAPVDQTYSQFKDKTLTPWLYKCPSQILRNTTTNWYQTYCRFMQGECGKPKRKHKNLCGSIHLTRELFRFEKCKDGNTRLFIGTKTNNLGYLSFKKHRSFTIPNSIVIKKQHGRYSVSFSYGEPEVSSHIYNQANLQHLSGCEQQWLEKHTVGIDRGVIRPVQAGDNVYQLTQGQQRNKTKYQRKLKYQQKQLSRRKKGSNRRHKARYKLSRHYSKLANLRKDFNHQTSHSIVTEPNNKIIVLEDLKTKNMTKRPKPKKAANGHYEKNQARAKAGLNRSILDKGWHQLEAFIDYKCQKEGKAFFKVNAHYTSQACADCDHTHPDNRKSQAVFACVNCGHTDNADRNAAKVIKKRAIKLLLYSGTELTKRGVLKAPNLDIGRGAEYKTQAANAACAVGCEPSKKKRTAVIHKIAA